MQMALLLILSWKVDFVEGHCYLCFTLFGISFT